jgi:hypothetical protein
MFTVTENRRRHSGLEGEEEQYGRTHRKGNQLRSNDKEKINLSFTNLCNCYFENFAYERISHDFLFCVVPKMGPIKGCFVIEL